MRNAIECVNIGIQMKLRIHSQKEAANWQVYMISYYKKDEACGKMRILTR
jgi:hypothetical protein